MTHCVTQADLTDDAQFRQPRPKVKAEDARKIERDLTRCGAILMWRDWTFLVSPRPTKSNDIAAETVVDYRRSITAFASDFLEYRVEDQKRVYAHEIAHVFLRRFGEIIRSHEKAIDAGTFEALKDLLGKAEEEACEHLELVLSKLIPNPTIPNGKKRIPVPTSSEDDE